MGLLDRSQIEDRAHRLVQRMPELLVEASRVAHTVTHGLHGRRRKGPGETFWQFRPFGNEDGAAQIDWRRSAASDTLYVREREWEAAHTIWLWPDCGPAMDFASHLSPITKMDRVLVLTLALAELLVRAGERVGIPGLLAPSAARNTARRIGELLLAGPGTLAGLPPVQHHFGRFSECVIISDFLDPLEAMTARFDLIAAHGVRGHLLQVLDPAEESLPYRGRILFEDMAGGDQVLAGRAEALQAAYVQRLAAHRQVLADRAARLNWSFIVHHTDRPAPEALLALYARLSGGGADYRQMAAAVVAGTDEA